MSGAIFREYFLNTSFHGYRYIADKNRHWTEKIFWLICCILSWVASLILIWYSWDDFQNHAISFVVDTNYLDWDTNFPSISVCETDNLDKIADATDRNNEFMRYFTDTLYIITDRQKSRIFHRLFGDPHDYNLDEIVKELVFYKGLSFYTLQTCGPESNKVDENCFKKNFTYFQSEIRSTCKEMFRKCEWNEEAFDCCQYFEDLDTELGKCFSLNSIQSNAHQKHLNMISNMKNGPGTLRMELTGIANVYILGEQEVPSLTTLSTDLIQVTPHVIYSRRFAIKEIDNQAEVKEVSIRQRKCRFSDESNLDVYRHYSFSACCVQCRKQAQLKKCKCTHHLMPNTTPSDMCDINGLYCLNTHYNELAVLKPYWSQRTGLVCDCLPSCTEIEIEVITDTKQGTSENYAVVELILDRLPTERFKRNVVKGKLDLVVSMGGTTALFLGASLLSFVELFYYFFVRHIWNYYTEKGKNI